ncbi:hypothetical protein OC861_000394 [Tilletia horrida]|nr:hypothetical protein OC861_000394 [Tilletia horrida]
MVPAFAKKAPLPPRKVAKPLPQSPAARILALPTELLLHIFLYCATTELVQLRATCRQFSQVVQNVAFDRALFRKVAKILSDEETKEMASGVNPQKIQLHPALSHVIWHAARGHQDVTLVKHNRKELLSKTSAPQQLATNPPLRMFYIRLQNLRSAADFEMGSVGFEDNTTGVIVDHLLLVVCHLVIQWRKDLTDVEDRHNLDRVVYPFSKDCWFQWDSKDAPTLFIPFGKGVPSWERVRDRRSENPLGGRLGPGNGSDDGGDSD